MHSWVRCPRGSLLSGLDPKAKAAIGDISTVKAGDKELTFFVAASLTVAGTKTPALWVTTAADGTGALFSLDKTALRYSSWNDAAKTQAKYSADDPAAKAALKCL